MKLILTSGFFASKTLGLDLDPLEARSRYGMRDEQEKRGRPPKPQVENF